MVDHHEQAVETIEARIAAAMCDIQADYYGIAPRKAEAHYLPGKIVTVILRETFTKAEQRLIVHGSNFLPPPVVPEFAGGGRGSRREPRRDSGTATLLPRVNRLFNHG